MNSTAKKLVFVSYAHEDGAEKDELVSHLEGLVTNEHETNGPTNGTGITKIPQPNGGALNSGGTPGQDLRERDSRQARCCRCSARVWRFDPGGPRSTSASYERRPYLERSRCSSSRTRFDSPF